MGSFNKNESQFPAKTFLNLRKVFELLVTIAFFYPLNLKRCRSPSAYLEAYPLPPWVNFGKLSLPEIEILNATIATIWVQSKRRATSTLKMHQGFLGAEWPSKETRLQNKMVCVCVHMCVRILLKSALSLSEREPLLKSALRSSDKDISFFLYCYFPFLCSEDLSEPTHFSPYFTQIQHFNGSLWMKSLSYSTVVTGPKILQNQIPPQCYFIIFPEFRTLISVYLSTNI